MPMGIPGATAWVLMISVSDPVPRPEISIPYAVAPPVELESEAKCREVASAINAKASEAGVEQKLFAECKEIIHMDMSEELRKSGYKQKS